VNGFIRTLRLGGCRRLDARRRALHAPFVCSAGDGINTAHDVCAHFAERWCW